MKVIVSLTSIRSRLESLQLTVQSLLNQSLLPDEIHINLSKDPYLLDQGILEIPKWLESYKTNQLIKVNWCENIGPYRKLLPIIETFEEEDIIVICDDDVLYHESWLSNLVAASSINPNKIICTHARRITKNFLFTTSYIFWPITKVSGKKSNILPIGVGGILYKKKFFNLDALYDVKYKDIAPTCDDFWFWMTACKVDQVHILSNTVSLFEVSNSESSLTKINYRKNKKYGIRRLIKVFVFIYGILGGSIINNDKVYKEIKKYFKDL